MRSSKPTKILKTLMPFTHIPNSAGTCKPRPVPEALDRGSRRGYHASRNRGGTFARRDENLRYTYKPKFRKTGKDKTRQRERKRDERKGTEGG
uniref:Uncharacterized protein n=1 Tax=Physcomitrium patens TaxID=3218 RepID=A0A2K1IEV5_PHYPA|nr:hypothetical protein PHYPA_029955 [Physcomitrium patens]